MRDLLYVQGNTFIPWGVTTSTARLGDKWAKQVDVGELVRLREVSGGTPGNPEHTETFGYALVVAKESNLTIVDVLDNADHNHVAFEPPLKPGEHRVDAMQARLRLWDALRRAYGVGPFHDATTRWTVLHILRVPEHSIVDLLKHHGGGPDRDEARSDAVPGDNVSDGTGAIEALVEALGDFRNVGAVEVTMQIGEAVAVTQRAELVDPYPRSE